MTDQTVASSQEPWGKRVDVDVMGIRIGTAETWDQQSPTETVFSGFHPNPGYEHFFPVWDAMDLAIDPFVGTLKVTNTETEEIHDVLFGFRLGAIFA